MFEVHKHAHTSHTYIHRHTSNIHATTRTMAHTPHKTYTNKNNDTDINYDYPNYCCIFFLSYLIQTVESSSSDINRVNKMLPFLLRGLLVFKCPLVSTAYADFTAQKIFVADNHQMLCNVSAQSNGSLYIC